MEVLTIHKPLARLTYEDSQHVIEALHDHITNKGLDIPGDSAKRRPRTVIISAGSDRIAEASHNVLFVDPVDGISLLFPP
mmetsp:Transcript_940/g.1708  ORF Transcript_940/g.1708 Transcript_940/m.1708 type:complete len:80 (-) Transcript_940:96-335(-)